MITRKIAHVTESNQIDQLNNVIHDCFFDVDDVVFDSNTSSLTIKFERETLDKSVQIDNGRLLKKWELPVIECLMVVGHVIDYQIEDSEGVGRYDLSELSFDPQTSRIIVKTGIPIRIDITVQNFDIEIEETDKIIRNKEIRSAFDIRKI